MSDLTWEAVLGRPDLIGGYIKAYHNGRIYAGPLSAIVAEDGAYRFESPWRAQRGRDGQWHAVNSAPLRSAPGGKPEQIADGTFVFSNAGRTGFSVLFPKTVQPPLNPDKVQGLPPASQRLLRLFPGLSYDETTALQVCADKAFDWLAPRLAELPRDASIQDLVKSFRHDASAEEFLWYYIELVTGQQKVHHRVY